MDQKSFTAKARAGNGFAPHPAIPTRSQNLSKELEEI
jgi:hypothetical protein